MRAVLIIAAAAMALGACASGAGPEGGVATYDALRRATADCKANGGTLVLKKEGNPEDIGAYACERK